MTSATQDPPKDDKDKGGITAGSLRQMIREEISNIVPSVLGQGKKSTSDDGDSSGDVKTQVSVALHQLQLREKREQRDKEVDAMLEKYNKPPEEKPPVEHRWIEGFMGWHSKDD